MAEKRVQRRLAAILAADVAGYSRLMQSDEEGTLERLRALRDEVVDPAMEAFTGRLVKTMGDGLLIEFPSAVDAVRCALRIQSDLPEHEAARSPNQPIEFRIGINVGDIIVEGDDILGDGVNIAARLEALADLGGICVSGMVYDQVKDKIDLVVEDLGERPLKNMASPVRLYRIVPTGGDGPQSADTSEGPSAIMRRPAVAVLSFTNMSGDPDQEYFADGLTEDIITALTAWNSFPVIGRNSSFVYKGLAVKLQQIGEELGARYIVEGSVRKTGNQVRATAQLIDARTGTHVWASRYDRELADIFAVQDEITYHVVSALVPEIERAEARHVAAKPPASMDAWDFYLRGLSLVNQVSREPNAPARELLERAIAMDPGYAKAHALVSLTYLRDLYMQLTLQFDETARHGLEAATRAVELDETDSYCHWVLGLANLWSRRPDAAMEAVARAKALNATDWRANSVEALILLLTGRPDDAIAEFETVIRFNPLDALNRVFFTLIARAHFDAGRYESAIEWTKRAMIKGADFFGLPMILSASLAHLGRIGEAKAVLEGQTVDLDIGEALGVWWQLYTTPEPNEHLREGLRKAGWEG